MIEPAVGNATQTSEVLRRTDALCQGNHSKADFYGKLLTLMVEFVGAEAGRIWRQGDDAFGPIVGIGELGEQEEVHQWCASQARERFESTIHFYGRKTEFSSGKCCVGIPLADDHRCFAVATIDLPLANLAAAEPYVAVLSAIAERVGKRYVAANFAQSNNELASLREAKDVGDAIGRHLNLKELAYEAVNRLQHYLGSDRVSLAIRHGNTAEIKAISNQAVFDRRSNVVRCLERLAAQVVKTSEPLWYPTEGDTPPVLRKLIERYFEAADTLGIALIPIFAIPRQRDNPEDIAATIQNDEDRQECVAVLILEGIEQPIPQAQVETRWNRVRRSVSNSVAIARRYDRLFLMPVWQSLGAFAELYRGHTQRKAILITLAIAAGIAALIVVPADFKIRGDGVIQPVNRRHVYAEVEGAVDDLRVKAGNNVERGDLLIRLKNPELDAKAAELMGKLREAESQLSTAMLQRVSKSFKNEQEERDLVRNTVNLESRIAGLNEQLAVLKRSQEQLEVRSPVAGEVISWDVDQKLRNRPVQPGQKLLTIAQLNNRWEVELRLPDKRSGYLLEQWEEHGQQLTASFMLSSDPTTVHHGQVVEVAPSSNVDDANENVVRVRIAVSPEVFAQIRDVKPGVTVVGHVYCGRASIGYCKLYEFFDWAKRMWFKFVA